MNRQIYIVDFKVMTKQGNYSSMSSYPKTFDSNDYQQDMDKTLRRAWSAYHKAISDAYAVDDRPLQAITITQMDGRQLDYKSIPELFVPEQPEEPQNPEEPGEGE